GLIEVAKIGGLPKRFAPVLAIVLGILAGVIYLEPESMKGGVLKGIAIGLASVGLYSGTRNVIRKKQKNQNEEDGNGRSEEHTSELQSRFDLVCRLLL